MKTFHESVMDSTEFAAMRLGNGDKSVTFFAPITRIEGVTWIHPTYQREFTWDEAKKIASRIWIVSGSLWNPVAFRLVYSTDLASKTAIRRLSR